jgi:hypothetical protein
MKYITDYQILLKRTRQLYTTSKIKMTINYTKQKIGNDDNYTEQNWEGRPLAGGGANGE